MKTGCIRPENSYDAGVAAALAAGPYGNAQEFALPFPAAQQDWCLEWTLMNRLSFRHFSVVDFRDEIDVGVKTTEDQIEVSICYVEVIEDIKGFVKL